MTLVSCLEKFNKDQSMCAEEIIQFNKCFVEFKQFQMEEKEKKVKGILPIGQRAKFTGDQMNEYFKKFPLSGREKQVYFHPAFRPNISKSK